MSDGTFVILSKGRAIFQGGDDKNQLSNKRERRATKLKTEIINPIFKKAAEYIKNDPFWYKILIDASKGYFLKMYRYINGTLTFKQKSKVFSKEICQDNAELCLRNVQDFMQSNGTYSLNDHELKMKEDQELQNEASNIILEWKAIKSKKIKKILISSYIDYLKVHYSLTDYELSKLINLIKLCYSVGFINNSSVIMENNEIVDIDILCYDPATKDFFIDADAKIPKTTRRSKKYIKSDQDNDSEVICQDLNTNIVKISKSRSGDWNKFTTLLGKRIAVYNKLSDKN